MARHRWAPADLPTLRLVLEALSAAGADHVAARAGCLLAHPDAPQQGAIREVLAISAYRFEQAVEDLRWRFGCPPKGALPKHLLLFTIGHASGAAGRDALGTIEFGAAAAQRFVLDLPLPSRERRVLSCIVDPRVGTYEATERAICRSRTVVRRATCHLRAYFAAPKQGQLVLRVLHQILAAAAVACDPKGGAERVSRHGGPNGRPKVGYAERSPHAR